MKKVTLILFLVVLLNPLVSQVNTPKKTNLNLNNLTFDIYGGTPVFHGDIKNNFGYNFTGRLNWVLTNSFSLGAEVSIGKVSGENKKYLQEYFSNSYSKILFGTEFYFYNLLSFSNLSERFQPYAGLSLGTINSNIKRSGNNLGDNNRLYNGWDFAHQWHAGLKYKVSKRIDVNFRYSILLIKTDNFDNINTTTTVNKFDDALSNIDLGVTIHFGKKKSKSIIWNTIEKGIHRKQNKNAGDSLALNIDEIKKRNSVLEQKLETLEKRLNIITNAKKNVKKEEILVAPLNAAEDFKYYIILGSYGTINKANKKIYELKILGHKPFIVYDSKSEMNRVAITGTDDLHELNKKLKHYQETLNPTAWVIQKK